MRSLAIIISIILVGCSRYDYTERAADGVRQPVRVDRVTGRTEVLTSNAGWVELKIKPQPTPIPSSVPCSAEEIRLAHTPAPETPLLGSLDKYLPESHRARMKHCRETHPR